MAGPSGGHLAQVPAQAGPGATGRAPRGKCHNPCQCSDILTEKRNKKCVLVNLSTLGLSTYADKMSRQDIQSVFTLVTSLQCTQQGAPAGLWSWAACYSSTRDTREAAYYTESPKVYGRGVTSLVGTEQTLPALWSAQTCTACTCCLAQPA